MMKASEIRQQFLDFFRDKQHKIVPSAPIVNREDPTLMFTNAGMNQFKDFFLGNATPDNPRIADTQKCMRVSGKHNDLEDVGRDGTHHTMFEMLGNWSIGDYFKEEALSWSWELLTSVYGIAPDRLYATVFGGDEREKLPADDEAKGIWLRFLPADRVLYGNKKDNFWEMGDTGPCGPCSEIHVDLRSDEERAAQPGHLLVNTDHPRVIEIWNNVFIQFNRKADGQLEALPASHVDTGMGFERLCMVLQGKTATYDTDIFTPLIRFIEQVSGKQYTASYAPEAKSDMAMRVVADHIRAVAFTIADGQLPASGGAGYVVRRILRRAVRYYYSFLNIREPFLHRLIAVLAQEMGSCFPELAQQREQVARIVEGEEKAFLHTLENGLHRFDALQLTEGQINGQDAFELYDTFGFPIDLTRLLAAEKGLKVDEAGFEKALQQQKERSRADAAKEVGDWTVLHEHESVHFIGYDQLTVHQAQIIKYRTVKIKGQDSYQLVLNHTPFYAESGGQTGDTGELLVGAERIEVVDTQKENDMIIHLVDQLPANPGLPVTASVHAARRRAISCHHSAVHLMHAALHEVLGPHALQKGQDVTDERLRFDFSHFQKVTEEELTRIEQIVNRKIRENIALDERRNVPIDEARQSGAMMLFGEKYGEFVRIITFEPDFSVELCGGTHVTSTGEIGLFRIVSEGAVAAGVRRIEAVAADAAEQWLNDQLADLQEIRLLLRQPRQAARAVEALQEEVRQLRKEKEQLQAAQAAGLKDQLLSQFTQLPNFKMLAARVAVADANAIKTLAFQLEKEAAPAAILLGNESDGKPMLTLILSKSLSDSGTLNASQLIRELAKDIQGGGGGQPFFATAGGKNLSGLDSALGRFAAVLQR
jgi:alanyl-tRNA synthetase